MRLIDADKLIKDMRDKWDMQDLYLPIHFKELLIDEQQTAFDVDKVVKGLEELRESEDVDGRAYYTMSEKEAINKAIKIVKAGAIDEYDRE